MKEHIKTITGLNLKSIINKANELELGRKDFIGIIPYACGEFALLYWSHE